jgi:hypothetical protein
MLILGLSPVSAGADVRPAVPLNAAHSAPSAVTPVAQKNFGAGGGHIGGGHIGNMGGMRMAHPGAHPGGMRPFAGGGVKPDFGVMRPKGNWKHAGNWNGVERHRGHHRRGHFYPYFYPYPIYDYSYSYADDDDCYWSRRYRRWVCPEY